MGTYKGLAVPLNGSATINGEITLAGGAILSAGQYINVGSSVTTSPTTGLTKGDLFVAWSGNDTPAMGICISTATQAVRYISAFDSATLGRASV